MSIKISFVIPVFNSAQHLPRLIDSLKAQKNDNWEALFTDDRICTRTEGFKRSFSVGS